MELLHQPEEIIAKGYRIVDRSLSLLESLWLDTVSPASEIPLPKLRDKPTPKNLGPKPDAPQSPPQSPSKLTPPPHH